MQVSNCKTGMQESKDENKLKKVNKVVSSKMSKSQKVAATSNSTPETYRESPQNVRLDTSESDEESVSEVKNALGRRLWLLRRWKRRQDSKNDEKENFSTSIGHHFDRVIMCVNGWCYLCASADHNGECVKTKIKANYDFWLNNMNRRIVQLRACSRHRFGRIAAPNRRNTAV